MVYNNVCEGSGWVNIRDISTLASDFGVTESYVTDEHFVAVVINGDPSANRGVVTGKVYNGEGLSVMCANGGTYRVISTVMRI